jgi:peptide/nickel transport system substrate-binding protein
MRNVLAAALAFAFVLSGCTQQNTSTTTTTTTTTSGVGAAGIAGATPPVINTSTTDANSWTKPHVLRMTYAAENIETLNPLLTSDSSVSQVLGPLSMGYLVRVDRDNNLVPELITQIPTQENGGVSKDGLTITYHLRKGVKWSDGAPFDADDVVFSFDAVMNPANNVTSRSGYDHIATNANGSLKIDEPDKYTVVLHMSKPYSPFAETFFSTAGANPALLPKHLLAGYSNLNNVAYNAKPVGIGPFMVKEWQRDQRVVLVPNPYYFRGQPKLKEIDDLLIPDVNTALTELQAKELDMSYTMPVNMLEQVRTLRDFVTWAQPSYIFRHVDFNLMSPKLKDPAVRQALRYAMNRPMILQTLYHGVGILQDQPAPRVSVYWDPKIPLVPFDLAKASRLLDQAGWKPGPDGIRQKNGVRLDLNFATASGTVINDQLIELLRQTWKQIGVNITVSHYQNTLLFGQYQDNGILARGKFDVAYFAWGVDQMGDLSVIYSCQYVPPNGQNYMHWCNPIADKAMNDFYTHYNQAQRNQDDHVVDTQLNKDVPTVVLMGSEVLWVYNKDLKNFHPGALSPFDNFMDVDI